MGHRFLEILGTPAVHAAQAEHGSRQAYARLEGGAPGYDRLGADEVTFITGRDGMVMASVSETGWPYVQHRGGPAGFLKVLDERTIGFADYRGNKQYISVGNTRGNHRVALLLIDHAMRRRLKVLGRAEQVDLSRDTGLAAQLVDGGYAAKVERGWRIHVEAFDWNCPQHITPRFTAVELEDLIAPMRVELDRLQMENLALKARLERSRLREITP
jgi:predicted pyridoxine 5'-phosphate oxidase superfamily flavin-nucleotide-binding protein